MSTKALEIAQKQITFRSMTPTHPDTTPEEAAQCSANLDYLQQVTEAYVEMSHRFVFSGTDARYPHAIDNLWLCYKQNRGNRKLRRLLVLCHVDVVPVAEANWSVPPFEGRIENGRLIGRGATDMKGPSSAVIAALNNLTTSDDQRHDFKADVIVTADEEYAALNGVARVLRHLKDTFDVSYDAVLIVEPSSPDRVGRVIATGRRGSYNGKVIVRGRKGHRAYPNSFRNPVPVAAQAVLALQNLRFEDSPEWLAQTDIEVRNITTDSDSTSVIPSFAALDWNIRFTGNYTPEQLQEMMTKAVANLQSDDFEIVVECSQYPKSPYLGKPKAGRGPELLNAFQSYLTTTYGEPALITHEGGMSDGCNVIPVLGDIEILEVGPDTTPMHQDNESIAVSDLEDLQTMYESAIPIFCQMAGEDD